MIDGDTGRVSKVLGTLGGTFVVTFVAIAYLLTHLDLMDMLPIRVVNMDRTCETRVE